VGCDDLQVAVGDRLIAASPCIRIALPKKLDTEVIPLSGSDVSALADAVPLRYRALIVFAAGMGMRQGECFGLTVDRVDFLRKHVRVDRQLVAAKAGVPGFGPPKSKAGFRTVPMPDVVSSALAERLARHGPPGGAGVHQHAREPAHPQSRRRDVAPRRSQGRYPRVGHVPRSPPLLRLAAHRQGVLGEGGSKAARPSVCDGDAGHVRALVA
jgi:integrase